MKHDNYWADFWKDYGKNIEGIDEQTQVLRTYKQKPVSPDVWKSTLEDMHQHLAIKGDDCILELCCGNGLIARYFSPLAKKIVAVDVSKELIAQINHQQYPNIKTMVSDIRQLNFERQVFDKIIIYAGIQYLSLTESVHLFEKLFKWLTPQGILLVGDVPDFDNKWRFYSNSEYKNFYFDNLKQGKDVIGTWFEVDFFKNLSEYTGFKSCQYLPQDPKSIYSKFRFDIKFTK
ncbi:MAG: cyclopropane fatty-acyl-phospholipid synthase-like methyltransferase [Cognaticolwellia sp.]|jgi:cyclopropane fatty-acyl-phospholipid synthase-like methyltransferase